MIIRDLRPARQTNQERACTGGAQPVAMALSIRGQENIAPLVLRKDGAAQQRSLPMVGRTCWSAPSEKPASEPTRAMVGERSIVSHSLPPLARLARRRCVALLRPATVALLFSDGRAPA